MPLKKIFFGALGILSFALGVIGAFLPVLPTAARGASTAGCVRRVFTKRRCASCATAGAA